MADRGAYSKGESGVESVPGPRPAATMRHGLACATTMLLLGAMAVPQSADAPGWPQWGGPGRDFVVRDSADLADAWPETGPPVLWKRPLGEGHSTIAVAGDRLYTMYRPRPEELAEGEWAHEEAVVALDAADGTIVWEHRYPSSPANFRFGAGPHSTPLIVGDHLFAAGTNKQLHAFDRHTGDVVWSHDLVEEFGAPATLIRPSVKAGYAPSPLAWEGLVIVTAGGDGQSVMAFRQDDGTLVWSAGDFLIAPSSPILIDVDGETQLVVVGGQMVNGLDPSTGEILWSHPNDTQGDMNNSTAVWGADNLLFLSSSYDGGSRLLRLTRSDEGTSAEEIWFSRRLRIMIGNAVRVGDMVFGTSGDFGPQIITALDLPSGEPLWAYRGFNRAFFLRLQPAGPGAVGTVAEGAHLLILDEDGDLALAVATRDGLEVTARASVLEGVSWSAPTLVGTTLYARDRRSILALDLGRR